MTEEVFAEKYKNPDFCPVNSGRSIFNKDIPKKPTIILSTAVHYSKSFRSTIKDPQNASRQKLDIASGIQQLRNGVASELLDYSTRKKNKSCTFAEVHRSSSISSAQLESDGSTPGTTDLERSGRASKTTDSYFRSTTGTSGYSCWGETSSSDWSMGRKKNLYLSETPLPGVTMTPQTNFLPGSNLLKTPLNIKRKATISSSKGMASSFLGSSSCKSVGSTSLLGSGRQKSCDPKSTPHTRSAAINPNSAVIVALVEGRGMARGEIGFASIDLRSPTLNLSQFSDTQTYVQTITKLHRCQPLEIIMPNTACDNGAMTKLFKLVSHQFQNSNVSTVQRKYFNETKGLQCVKQLCVSDFNSVVMELTSKYYCLAAAAALVKYVEFTQNMILAPASINVTFSGCENTTMIDATTAVNLELLQNIRDPKSEHTLYGVLNYTKTVGGARLLRANILQPPCDKGTIAMRQEVVSELTEKEDVFDNIQTVIARFLDVDHILSVCVQIPKKETLKTAEANINNLILLKHILELVDPLRNALSNCENRLMKHFYKSLEDGRYALMKARIASIIHDDTKYQKGMLHMRTQKCFAVKGSINGLLDIGRGTYGGIIEDINTLANQWAEEYNLPIVTSYNSTRGFFLQLNCGPKHNYSKESLPEIFIKVTKAKNTLCFTTTELIRLNNRAKEALDEIYLVTNIVVTELLGDLRNHFGCLYKLSEAVAMIDMLQSFAHACTLSSYVKPDFTKDTLAIKQGRHPILEKISTDMPIPNNTYATEDSNFNIITGANMSGKSTYLRQIVLLQIMAQIGCFVPAEYASFRITDQIFSRIGSDDDIESNSSTFMLEMKEVNYIIQNVSHRSLIIMDELGRGTSQEEGVGICHAVCEYLLRFKAFVFFATHFKDLGQLESLYPNVQNYCFMIHKTFNEEDQTEKVVYTHVLTKGQNKEEHYGIRLAELSTLPRNVIQKAKTLASSISSKKGRQHEVDKEMKEKRIIFKLSGRLVQLSRNSKLNKEDLKSYLRSLKMQYLTDTKSLEE
ncbi:mutS protein homolog 4-like [Saccostrea echinata]|uniref:mutS protein homolog 4-like n=1 Tax=Saccostrea echinata TaxID=191078 RepID=UPI002A81934F|nr:mutS protein homolog 4-like [Saccostrea echinata]